MIFAAGADYSLALAAIPTSIAAMYVGRLTYKATRTALPAVQHEASLTPRLSEDRAAGWLAAMEAKDELIDQLRRDLAACREGSPS